MPPRQKPFPDSFHQPSGREKLLIPPDRVFFENLYPQQNKGREETMLWKELLDFYLILCWQVG